MGREPGQRHQLGTGATALVNPPTDLGTPGGNSSTPHKEAEEIQRKRGEGAGVSAWVPSCDVS